MTERNIFHFDSPEGRYPNARKGFGQTVPKDVRDTNVKLQTLFPQKTVITLSKADSTSSKKYYHLDTFMHIHQNKVILLNKNMLTPSSIQKILNAGYEIINLDFDPDKINMLNLISHPREKIIISDNLPQEIKDTLRTNGYTVHTPADNQFEESQKKDLQSVMQGQGKLTDFSMRMNRGGIHCLTLQFPE